jgi:hypothetical protein
MPGSAVHTAARPARAAAALPKVTLPYTDNAIRGNYCRACWVQGKVAIFKTNPKHQGNCPNRSWDSTGANRSVTCKMFWLRMTSEHRSKMTIVGCCDWVDK